MATSKIPQVTNNSGTLYCKMPDGTLIQWGADTIYTGSQQGPIGYVGTLQKTFPIPFVGSNPRVVASPIDSAGFWNASSLNISKTGMSLTVAGDISSGSTTANWIAIGRWK